jgi:uncharacterized UPF0160 family protein
MPTFVTHSGPFHFDEIFAIAFLEIIHGCGSIIRTRNPDQIVHHIGKQDTYILDVGSVFDPANRQFDHHQLKSSEEVPSTFLHQKNGESFLPATTGMVLLAHKNHPLAQILLASEIPQAIDAWDTGKKDLFPNWKGSTLIHKCNPTEPNATFDPRFVEILNRTKYALEQSLKLASDFETELEKELKEYAAQYDAAMEASKSRLLSNPVKNGIVQLPNYEIALSEFGPQLPKEANFVVYPQEKTWMVQQIPLQPHSMKGRKTLPAEWATLKDTAFQAKTGVNDAIFCHATCFIAGTKTLESALKLAAMAL